MSENGQNNDIKLGRILISEGDTLLGLGVDGTDMGDWESAVENVATVLDRLINLALAEETTVDRNGITRLSTALQPYLTTSLLPNPHTYPKGTQS